MRRPASSVVYLALIGLLAIAVSVPAAAAETSSPIEGWMDWLGGFWATVANTLDGLAGEVVPVGQAEARGGEIIRIGEAAASSQDEIGPVTEPFGGETASSSGQDGPDGHDEMGPMAEPTG